MKAKNMKYLLFFTFYLFLLTRIQGQEKCDIFICNVNTKHEISSIYIKEELSIKSKILEKFHKNDIILYVGEKETIKVEPKDSLGIKLKLDTLDLNEDKKDTIEVEIGFVTKVNSKDSILAKRKIKVGYIPAILFSSNSNRIDKADIRSKIKVRFLFTLLGRTDSLKIYVNNIAIGKLEKEAYEKNIYSFVLDNKFNKEDSLFKILDQDCCKSESKVSIYYGKTFEARTLLTDNFTILFGCDWIMRKTIAIIVMVCLFCFIIYFLHYAGKDQKDKKVYWIVLRDQSKVEDGNFPFSLARSQLAFWTILILIAYFIVWLHTGGIIQITGQLLGLLGISAGTTVVGGLIDNADIKNTTAPPVPPNTTNDVKRHQDDVSDGFMIDILSDQNGISIHRLQNVVFTIAIGCYFLYEVFHSSKIPALDNNLIILMGMSSAAYLAVKNGENKP